MSLRLSILSLVAVVVVLGCGEDPMDDNDEDLLTNGFEEAIGTDKDLADTDGDGTEDGNEYVHYFDPLRSSDAPYIGGYPRMPLPDEATWLGIKEDADRGWDEGEFTKSWKADDQYGQELLIKRFYGMVVLVDLSSEWCAPCRVAAETLDEEYQARKDDGFVVLQILMDGTTPGDADPDVDRWAEEFDVTYPLIADPDRDAADHYVPTGQQWGIPNYTIIGRDHTIRSWYEAGGEPNWELIDELLDEDPPEVDYLEPDNPGGRNEILASLDEED